MDELAVVSVDMFQTLVDIGSRRHHIWRACLQERYCEQLGEAYWALASRWILKYYHRLTSQQGQFLPLLSIFEACLADLFAHIGLDFCPQRAAEILVAQHRWAAPFRDTAAFLDLVAGRYPVCLVSDTDDDMLSPRLLGLCEFDRVFTSQQLRSYKSDPAGKLFSAVVAHYGVAPGQIVHIGDSSADVLGARRAGMRTCWLNRNASSWDHDARSDYVVTTLLEAASILGV
jgi:2-haloalkanoic acid dehalogenase type II